MNSENNNDGRLLAAALFLFMDNFWIYYPENHERHQQHGHPERPARLEVIRKMLLSDEYWKESCLIPPHTIRLQDLSIIHSDTYLTDFARIEGKNGQMEQDTYFTAQSFQIALNAAGGASAIALQVQDKGGFGLALCRPPGHHATKNFGMGFCLLNNIAYAAEFLRHQRDISPIAIIDIDLHHGNGTQDIFWNRSDIHYLSIHQYPFYPGTGRVQEYGSGEGEYTTVNFPIPSGAGDQALKAFTDDIVLPYLDRVKPKAVLVSAGFDGHWMDPIGELNFSEAGFYHFFRCLRPWIEKEKLPGVSLYLEGGYSLEATGYSTLASIAGYLDIPFKQNLGAAPVETTTSWKKTLKTIQSMWNL